MDEKYYAVKQKLHPSESKLAGLALVSVSEGEIKWRSGDTFLPTLLRLEGEIPVLKEGLVCEYNIYPMTKSQFIFYKAAIEGRTCGDGHVRTFADPSTKTIYLGEI